MTGLSELLSSVWAQLHQSAEIRDAGFRMAQLATIGPNGAPQLRTVVLRGAAFAERTLRLHSDIRSPKVAEIRANSAVSLVAYNNPAGQQIRVEGSAVVHQSDTIARLAWDGARAQSLVCYRTPFAPGSPLATADEAGITDAMRAPTDVDAGFEHFCAVVITVRRVDWLDLAASGHRRAVFDWSGKDWSGGWVAP